MPSQAQQTPYLRQIAESNPQESRVPPCLDYSLQECLIRRCKRLTPSLLVESSLVKTFGLSIVSLKMRAQKLSLLMPLAQQHCAVAACIRDDLAACGDMALKAFV